MLGFVGYLKSHDGYREVAGQHIDMYFNSSRVYRVFLEMRYTTFLQKRDTSRLRDECNMQTNNVTSCHSGKGRRLLRKELFHE